MKKIIWIITSVLIIAGVFFLYKLKSNIIIYETEPVERGNISSVIEATGKLKPKVMVDVGCQVTGKILKIYVDFNDKVKKGQLLAEIDPTLYSVAVADAQAEVNGAQQNVAIKQMSLKKEKEDIVRRNVINEKYNAVLINKKRILGRYIKLLEKNLVSQSDKDNAETDYIAALKDYNDSKTQLKQEQIDVNVAQAQVLESQSSLKKAQINLQKAQATLGYTKIISPVDGIIISKLFEEGQTIVSSFQTATLFKVANDLKKMQIVCEINESDIANIKVGQKVTFVVDAYPGKNFEGKISQIRTEPKEEDKAVYYDAVIDVENKDLLLKPGMTAQVKIITLSKENVLKLSNKALRFVPKSKELQEKLKILRTKKTDKETKEGETLGVVWVMKNKKVEPVNIALGVSDGAFTEIISGLNEKDLVVIEEKGKKSK